MKIEINLDEKYDDTMRQYAEVHCKGDVSKFAEECIVKQIDSAGYWNSKLAPDEPQLP